MNLPHILFLSLDATRFDLLFGEKGEQQAPFLNALSQRAIRFDNAYTTAPWTPPSHASMFTGLLPHAHGVQEGHLWLPEDTETLAGFLRKQGYWTVGMSSNPLLGPITNLNKDFEDFYELWRNPDRHQTEAEQLRFDDIILDSRTVVREMEALLEQAFQKHDGSPIFLFAQFIGPHNPYEPSQEAKTRYVGFHSPETWTRVEQINRDWRHFYGGDRQLTEDESRLLRELYQAELNDLDRGLQQFLAHPFIESLLPNAHVIITADHGEMLGEHQHIHHLFNLHEPLIHVPLLWRYPGQEDGHRDGQLIQHTVFLPVIRDLVAGRDILDAIADHRSREAISVLREPVEILAGLEQLAPEQVAEFRYGSVARRVGDLKFSWQSNGHQAVYDMKCDAGETTNLIASHRNEFDSFAARAGDYLGGAGDDLMQRQLRDLGYF